MHYCKSWIILLGDTFPSSLLDSNMSLRQKTTERLGAQGTFPGFQHLKGQRGVLELQDGTRKSDKQFIHSHKSASNQPQLGQYNVGAPLVLGRATSDLELTRFTMARTQGKPPPSPIQYTLHLSIRPTSKWLFVPRLPKGSLETTRVGTLATLWGYNFVLRPLIGTGFEANFQLLLRAFERCIAPHLHARKLGQFMTFCGQESNC